MDTAVQTGRGASLLARLENMPVSRFLIKTRIVVGVATFFDAFDALAIAYVLPVLVGLWKLTPVEIGFMISIGYVGQIIGALLFGWLAERCGRLRVAAWTVAIFGLASFACAFAPSYSVLLVLRFIQGIGLGGEVPIAAAYINEFSRAKGRGRFFMVYELVFPLGLLAAALIGMWAVPNLGWQSMFFIGAAPAILVLFMRRLLPESPRWLIARGRLDEAQEVVEKLERYSGSTYSNASVAAPVPAAAVEVGEKQGQWKDLFAGRYLKRTLVLWCLWVSTYFIVYGLTAWLPTVYRTVFKLPLDVSLKYALITTACGFAGNVVCAFMIDRTGRKAWFVSSFLLGGASLGALYFLGASSPMHVLVLASASYCFISSIALALYLYTPELYPTRVRALGVGAASSWLRIASAVGPTFVGALIGAGQLAPVFGVFALLALLGAVVMALFSEETTDRQLEEVSP